MSWPSFFRDIMGTDLVEEVFKTRGWQFLVSTGSKSSWAAKRLTALDMFLPRLQPPDINKSSAGDVVKEGVMAENTIVFSLDSVCHESHDYLMFLVVCLGRRRQLICDNNSQEEFCKLERE